MEHLKKVLLMPSGFISKNTVMVIFTYLYMLTFIVLIMSHVQIAKDHLLRQTSLRHYISRTLNAYAGDEIGSNNNTSLLKQKMGTVFNGVKNIETIVSDANKKDTKLVMNQIVAQSKNNIEKRDIEQPTNELRIVKDQAIEIANVKPKSSKGQAEIKPKSSKGQTEIKPKPNDILPIARINATKSAVKLEQMKIKPKYPDVEIVNNFVFNDTVSAKEEIWQNIISNGTFMIFSSFMDNIQGKPYIRSLAINGNTFLPKFFCELTYENTLTLTSKGKIWMLPDHHEKIYKPVFLYCPLPDDMQPVFVSIIPVIELVRLNKVPVINNRQELRNFTICLSPLFFNYSIEHELIQWLEINKLIGADFFMIYNYSTVGLTDEILHHYQKEGWVKVIQWHPPKHTDLHYYGQVAMMNDCLYRNYKTSRYITDIDLDELIIPRKGKSSWNDLINSLPKGKCEYNFRSTLMPFESTSVYPGKQKARELHLYFLLRITRREYIFEKNFRSKYIVNTTCVDTVGIHLNWKYRNGTADTERYHVPPREALMYHFRNEPVAKKGKEIEEKAVYKYHAELINNTLSRLEKLKSERKAQKIALLKKP